jgi:ABC-2 type transport system permease protein
MKMITHIAAKEIKSFFVTPMGWIILALVSFAFGAFYLNGVNSYFEVMSGAIRPAERVGVTIYVGQTVYGTASFLMLFAVPLLSMRLISEERKQQTLPFLFSAPVSIVDIVLGKFFGLFIFLAIMVVYMFVMLSTLNIWSDIDFGYLIANTFGLLLLVASFAAIGIYFSSLTSQPIVAAILSFIFAVSLFILERYFASQPNHWFFYISLMKHFQTFSRGVISSKDIIYFILFISTFLVLTIRRLDADRLRG